MGNIVTRLTNTGNLLVNGSFDEVTNTSIKVTTTTVYASLLDEVTISSGSVAHRQNSNGNLQIAGIFDEWTGMTVVDNSLVLSLDAARPDSYNDLQNLVTYSGMQPPFISSSVQPTGWSVDQGFGNNSLLPSNVSSSFDANGAGYFQFDIVGTTIFTTQLLLSNAPNYITLTPNGTYTVTYNYSLPSNLVSAGGGIAVQFLWYNSSTTLLSNTNQDSLVGWQQSTTYTKSSFTATAPSGAAYCRVRFYWNNPVAGGTTVNYTGFKIGGVQVELRNASGPYVATTSAAIPAATTWYDLSNTHSNASEYGTVPYSVDSGGCFDFATATGNQGYDASLGFTFAANMIPTLGSFTLSCWVKNPGPATRNSLFNNTGGGQGYRFAITLNTVYFLSGGTTSGYNEGNVYFTSSLSTSTWYNVTAIYDKAGTLTTSSTPKYWVYLNGVLQGSLAMDSLANADPSPNVAPGLVRGTWSDASGVYNGKLATFSAYSRALSANEISQNFEALRGRFGI